MGGSITTVSIITYANDTPTATSRGPLAFVTYGEGASFSSTNYGWLAGGYYQATANSTAVQRVTYATDTATSETRGPLTAGVMQTSATSGAQ
jgi:hypothetical protein